MSRRDQHERVCSTDYHQALTQLAQEVFSAGEWTELCRISVTAPFDREAFRAFDDSLWGPSVSRIVGGDPFAPGTLGIPGYGKTRCALTDRDVFRPLH